jgi:pimeloyl-ACP methyl ester carboxylesterase
MLRQGQGEPLVLLHGVLCAELLALADDTIGCEIVEDLLATDAQLAPLDPPPCPVTLAWSGQDRLFPVDVYGSHARELIPRASFIVLDDVGHVPMLDDPQLVAQTILASSSLSLDDRSILPIRSGTRATAR